MAKNVLRSNEIEISPTKVHISPPVLSRRVIEAMPAQLEELEDETPAMPVYTGPSADEVAREAEAMRLQVETERESLLDEAKSNAEKIVKDAEQVAFEEVQRKGEQAQGIRQEAEQQAGKIVAQAESKVVQLLDEANRKIADIHKEAFERGNQEGRVEGWQEGKSEADRLVDRLHMVLAKAIDRRNDIIVESESQLVSLVLAISKKVVKVLTENQRNVVINNVVQALRKLKSKSDVVIRVNIVDLKMTTEHLKEITARIERVGNVSLMEDATVDPGGCIIETDFGEIDARISSQLQEIEDKILEASPIRTRPKENSVEF